MSPTRKAFRVVPCVCACVRACARSGCLVELDCKRDSVLFLFPSLFHFGGDERSLSSPPTLQTSYPTLVGPIGYHGKLEHGGLRRSGLHFYQPLIKPLIPNRSLHISSPILHQWSSTAGVVAFLLNMGVVEALVCIRTNTNQLGAGSYTLGV